MLEICKMLNDIKTRFFELGELTFGLFLNKKIDILYYRYKI